MARGSREGIFANRGPFVLLVGWVSFIAVALLLAAAPGHTTTALSSDAARLDPPLPQGSKYRGYQFHHPNMTISARTVVETPFARAQVHTVRLESGKVVDDWLWFDEVSWVRARRTVSRVW